MGPHWSLCGSHLLRLGLITLYHWYVTRLTTYPLEVWTEHSNKPLHEHKYIKSKMDSVAEVLAADAVAGSAPVVAAAAAGIVAPANVAEDPIHAALRTCGVALLAARMTFINVESLDSISAFIQLNGDSDVPEMAKRMAARPSAAGSCWYNADQKAPSLGLLG